MSNFYMLCGVPGSGKSTWRNHAWVDTVIISTDDIIEDIAKSQGLTYNDVFQDSYKSAEQIALKKARKAFEDGRNVIWDQTNINRRSREKKLAMVPEGYTKYAVVFPVPDDLDSRLKGREAYGKTIPKSVVESMIRSFEIPTVDEGFDYVFGAYDEEGFDYVFGAYDEEVSAPEKAVV